MLTQNESIVNEKITYKIKKKIANHSAAHELRYAPPVRLGPVVGMKGDEMGGYRTNSGENLKKQWKIPAQQVRYHKDGTFFMPLDRFPAAFCDPYGYVLLNSQKEYETNKHIEIGSRVNVRCGISKLPGYTKVNRDNEMKTTEELKAYVQEQNRVCPEPGKWHQLWEMLPDREQKPNGGWNPPLPLILAAWPHTSALEKRLRLLEHINYAESHGVIEEISRFLQSLHESQWVHFGEV